MGNQIVALCLLVIFARIWSPFTPGLRTPADMALAIRCNVIWALDGGRCELWRMIVQYSSGY